MPIHDTLLAPGAIHPAAFVGPSDPAGTPTNYVAAGKFWVDTTGGGAVLKMRDAANAAWELVGLSGTANLLVNPGLEIWSRGPGPFGTNGAFTADRWAIGVGAGSALSLSRDAANADAGSQYAAAVTYTHAAESRVSQTLEAVTQLRGRTLTFAARVRTATPNAVRVGFWDSVSGYRYGGYHSGGGAYETLTLTAAIAAGATGLQGFVAFSASCTCYVDNAVLAVGAAAPPYAPLHPADDLARCLRYYEFQGGAQSTIYYKAHAGAVTDYLHSRQCVEKASTPTLTKVGTWGVSNCGQPVVGAASRTGYYLGATVSAIGTFSFGTSTATDGIILEANP